MAKSGRLLFDLNELPVEEEDEMNSALCRQPQMIVPTTSFHTSNLFPLPDGCQRIMNNHAFTHASSGSGFQPFVRSQDKQSSKDCSKTEADVPNINDLSPSMSMSHNQDDKLARIPTGQSDLQSAEREEGEWTDMEGNGSTALVGSNDSNSHEGVSSEIAQKQREAGEQIEAEEDVFGSVKPAGNYCHDSGLHGSENKEAEDSIKDVSNHLGLESSWNSDCCNEGDAPTEILPEGSLVVKPKDVKGVEASHALKFANNPLKRPKLDEHKEAMLGKKRARQTMFINVEDAKLTSSMKISTPRRRSSFPVPIVTRTVKDSNRLSYVINETCTERQSEPKDQKKSDTWHTEGITLSEFSDQKGESNGYSNPGSENWSKKINGELPKEVQTQMRRQGSWKQPLDSRQFKNPPISSRKPTVVGQSNADPKAGNKKHLPSKKQTSNNLQYQDTSVERLIREVTNDKFWHHPEESELQCVPGYFESVEEYVRVFEPLLFEECQAQLYSTWEELTESTLRDAHIMVRVKTVERRERARSGRRNMNGGSNEEDVEPEITGKVAGTVRRHIPIETRDSCGAIFHFYIGESYDSSSKMDDHHALRKFQPKSIWYLTVLGSLATTQREYVALHAFRRLNLQMQSAILKPSPEHFPKSEQQPPAMPECFTPNFVDYLHKTFNAPQLAAIQWAAMHTAAGTNSGVTKKQDPWPFTLVQGPPGTGKTHTVWGMLNVIHLVQYQHYYAALLKKLAPESYKQTIESNYESVGRGTIDEVLHSMDQNLFRTLPKLCPKPRMLVCAPSNAATDELLARVLDRGFIDGEMKVYRPDVARVGVDTQTRAAQAVSVERRTEQLLLKGRDEVIGWMHNLRAREAQFSQQITAFQRELSVAAAAGQSQGSVGVDPDVLVAWDHNRDVLLQNLSAAVEGRDKVLVEMSRLLILESRFRPGSSFNLEDARANLEASFANEAEIVFTTVSSSGRKLFSRLTHGFDMVVIDEAAQASEVAVLPPLSLGAARCVLVGDPQQLPATVISKAAGTLLYSRSLFERFQQAGCPTILLSVQYRMHPQIRDFPSRYFYQGRLTDSESVANLPDEVYYKDPLLQPYMFYDIMHGRESHRGGSVSYQNMHEAQFSLQLYEYLQKILKSNGGKKVSVGIITPYKLQLKCLQREFEGVLSSEEGKDIYINTVDAFQGQERDVIIMSCVRASNHGVGFVADVRRMNVALTRARRALWVVGNANALMQSDDWAALIADAKSRKCFIDMDSIPKEFLVLKGLSCTPTKVSSNNMRSLRTGSQRQRHLEMFETKPNTQAEDEEKLKTFVPRNGSYRNLKPIDNSLDDLSHSGDRSQDALQYGAAKKQNSVGGRREM